MFQPIISTSALSVLVLLLSIFPLATCAGVFGQGSLFSSPALLRVSQLRASLTPRRWRRADAGDNDGYTPLLFFTVPRGLLPECDAMEDAVRQVERELQVRVQRLDVLRQPANEAVLHLITQQHTPPFLYHRESCQTMYLTPAQQGAGSASKKEKETKKEIYVNKDRIRAWAKGRYLTGHSAAAGSMEDGMAVKKVNAPNLLPTQDSEDGGAMDQAELMEEMALTPEQLKGKRLIEERTKAKAKQS